MEAPLPFWATCSCVWLPPQQKVLFLCSYWISWGLICARYLCPGTEHFWKEPDLLIFICSSRYLYTLIRYPCALCSSGWTVSAFPCKSRGRKRKEFVEEQWSELNYFFLNYVTVEEIYSYRVLIFFFFRSFKCKYLKISPTEIYLKIKTLNFFCRPLFSGFICF